MSCPVKTKWLIRGQGSGADKQVSPGWISLLREVVRKPASPSAKEKWGKEEMCQPSDLWMLVNLWTPVDPGVTIGQCVIRNLAQPRFCRARKCFMHRVSSRSAPSLDAMIRVSRHRLLSGWTIIACAIVGLVLGPQADAHFLVLIPNHDVVEEPSQTKLVFDIQFTHPMDQGPIMPMADPVRFFVVHKGRAEDLKSALQPRSLEGQPAYTAQFQLRQPGDHVFAIEPAPYWEKLEKKWIIHYTKVVVNFLGDDGQWEQPIGLPVEIQPLTRPYGLWAGNTFRGIVLHDGKPVPFARVEVEYWNQDHRVQPPNGSLVTQVVKADGQGVFCYTVPWAGWWGFAALVEGEQRPGPDGQPADVELGGLIWVRAVDPASGSPAKKAP